MTPLCSSCQGHKTVTTVQEVRLSSTAAALVQTTLFCPTCRGWGFTLQGRLAPLQLYDKHLAGLRLIDQYIYGGHN